MENKMLPSIGRIVHYTNLGDKDGKFPPEIQAAVITGVYFSTAKEGTPFDDTNVFPDNQVNAEVGGPRTMFADLRVLYRTGEFNMVKCPWSEVPARGHWNWPPRT